MSDPQIVDAFIRMRTSAGPGSGTETSRKVAVLFPGRIAPFIEVQMGFTVTNRACRPAGAGQPLWQSARRAGAPYP